MLENSKDTNVVTPVNTIDVALMGVATKYKIKKEGIKHD